MMNFTGDGNGFDMVTMPQELRERVPTSNFFLRGGYERNPIARRTGTVAALYAAIEAKMDRASREPGARELAAAFQASAAVVRAEYAELLCGGRGWLFPAPPCDETHDAEAGREQRECGRQRHHMRRLLPVDHW